MLDVVVATVGWMARLMVWSLAAVVVLTLLSQLGLFVVASIGLRRHRVEERHRVWRRLLGSPLAPQVSVLVPAYNEEISIADSVSAMLALNYPNLEVVVVSDGSSDATVERLIEHFGLYAVHPIYRRSLETQPVVAMYKSVTESRLVVVDKRNGGKADALNCALNIASGELVCSIDADTLVSPDCLQEVVMPFLARPDTVAVGGTVRLANGAKVRSGQVQDLRPPSDLLAGAQVVEYLRAFLVGRMAWNLLGGNLIISGAFGVFRRASLIAVGGYLHGSVGEDMELVVRLRRLGYEKGEVARVVFLPDPVAWTEAPESLRVLARQRNRWYRGLLDVLIRHRRMLFNPKYGTAGMLSMPYFLLVEALAPIIAIMGMCGLGLGLVTGSLGSFEVMTLVALYLIGVLISLLVLLYDELGFRSFSSFGSRFKMLGYAVFEAVAFRPMTAIWALWGLKLFLQGKAEWGAQTRHGFAAET